MKAVLHIYELSKLVHALPPEWERKLHELEESRKRAYAYYQPAREAIIKLAARSQKRLAIYDTLVKDAQRIAPGRGQDPVKDNVRAFEVFGSAFLPKIQKFLGSYLRTDQSGGMQFGGVLLLGLPHLAVWEGS